MSKEEHALDFSRAREASIGRLTLGIAHELNNPIGFVSSNLQSLEDYVDDLKETLKKIEDLQKSRREGDQAAVESVLKSIDQLQDSLAIGDLIEDLEDLTSESLEGMDRLKNLVNSLQEFGKKDSETTRVFKLEPFVSLVLNVLRNELKYTGEVILSCDESIAIEANEARLAFSLAITILHVFTISGKKGRLEIDACTENSDTILTITSEGYEADGKIGKDEEKDFETARKLIEEMSGEIAIETSGFVKCQVRIPSQIS